MARTKSFSSLNVAAPEPVEFTLNDRTWHCVSVIPGAVLLDFAGKLKAEDPASMADAVNDFFDLAVLEPEREAFRAFLRDPAQMIGIDVMMEVAEWLMEEFMGSVPLEQGQPSSVG